MTSSEYALLYCTMPNKDEAHSIAKSLLEAGLIACANIIPAIESLYIWEGALCEDHEALLCAKTTMQCSKSAIHHIKERHPYDVPAISLLPIAAGLEDFLAWIDAQTRDNS